jgi:CRP-like cAMP-binding protein
VNSEELCWERAVLPVTSITGNDQNAQLRFRMMPDKIWFLRRLNLFDGLSYTEVQDVSRQFRMRRCAVGTQIVGADTDRIYLLKEGRIRLYHLSPEGHEMTVGVLSPGQIFGFGAFFGQGDSLTHAEALEDSWVCDTDTHHFLTIMTKHPLMMARVMMSMARHIFQLEETIEAISTRPVKARLAGYLLALAESCPSGDCGMSLKIPSQGNVAKRLGTSRETVARALGGWRRQGVISGNGHEIVLRDLKALRLAAREREAQSSHPSREGTVLE